MRGATVEVVGSDHARSKEQEKQEARSEERGARSEERHKFTHIL